MSEQEGPRADSVPSDDALALLIAANLAESGSGFIKTAGRVATVSSVAVSINPLEPTQHKSPHFHARFNDEEEAVYAIENGSVLSGKLKPARHKAVVEWYSTRKDKLTAAWDTAQRGQQPYKIAASAASFRGEGSASATLPPGTASAVGQIVMMELDVFINRVKQIAKDQSLGSDAEIHGICNNLSDEIYSIAQRLCDVQRKVMPE